VLVQFQRKSFRENPRAAKPCRGFGVAIGVEAQNGDHGYSLGSSAMAESRPEQRRFVTGLIL
jgi:hypothetical protein